MTAGELIQILETHNPDKIVVVKTPAGTHLADRVDSFEDALVLIADEPA